MNIETNQCELCGLIVLKKNFKRHYKKHEDENEKQDIKCEVCDQKFSRTFNLNRHIEKKHTVVKIKMESNSYLEESEKIINIDRKKENEVLKLIKTNQNITLFTNFVTIFLGLKNVEFIRNECNVKKSNLGKYFQFFPYFNDNIKSLDVSSKIKLHYQIEKCLIQSSNDSNDWKPDENLQFFCNVGFNFCKEMHFF